VTRDWAERAGRAPSDREDLAEVAGRAEGVADAIDIRNAMEKLDENSRRMIELVLGEGYSPPEAARELGIGRWSAYKRYERALRKLRDLLAGS
jgi:RNA polymerase sigma factor (sigma-70 family)